MARSDVSFSAASYVRLPNAVLGGMSVGLHAVVVEYSDICRVMPLSWHVAQCVSKARVPATACAVGMCRGVGARDT